MENNSNISTNINNNTAKYQCSSKDHSDFPAMSFCQKCEIYMCSNCDSIHSNLCPNHQKYDLTTTPYNSSQEIFTGFCPKENHHQIKLDYYCKSHNQLCCAACIAKIKDKENGQHNDCDVCSLEEIKEEKKEELNKNIIYLENLSKKFGEKFQGLKDIYDDVYKEKEELKLYIQKIFKEIKNNINIREKQLLLEIENQFNDVFCNEDIVKESENLPDKIKNCLNKGIDVNKKWNMKNIELNLLINECLDIEKIINEINIINNNIKKLDINYNTRIRFKPENEEIKIFNENIKNFGEIYQIKNYFNYTFKPYPLNVTLNEKRQYQISGENDTNNILTKTGPDGWMGTICENILDKSQIYRWKIKILKTQNKHIMVGIAPNDFDINLSDYNNCGYYFYFYNSTLYSGPPYSYYGENSFLSKLSDDTDNEIVIIANLKNRTLKFIINGEDKGDSYKDIPEDKPLSPAVILYNQNDSIEIISF